MVNKYLLLGERKEKWCCFLKVPQNVSSFSLSNSRGYKSIFLKSWEVLSHGHLRTSTTSFTNTTTTTSTTSSPLTGKPIVWGCFWGCSWWLEVPRGLFLQGGLSGYRLVCVEAASLLFGKTNAVLELPPLLSNDFKCQQRLQINSSLFGGAKFFKTKQPQGSLETLENPSRSPQTLPNNAPMQKTGPKDTQK